MRSGKTLNKTQPVTRTTPKVIIQEHKEESIDDLSNGVSLKDVIIPKNKVSESQHNIQTQVPQTPPFPERLLIEKPIAQSKFDIINELKNGNVKIPLLQEIKDVMIYAKTIKEICIKKPGRK